MRGRLERQRVTREEGQCTRDSLPARAGQQGAWNWSQREDRVEAPGFGEVAHCKWVAILLKTLSSGDYRWIAIPLKTLSSGDCRRHAGQSSWASQSRELLQMSLWAVSSPLASTTTVWSRCFLVGIDSELLSGGKWLFYFSFVLCPSFSSFSYV